jgi:hypothetical protein
MTDKPASLTAAEPWRFTDADGDYLHIGVPATPACDGPAISFHTATEPVHVPVDRVEELITALRRMAGLPAPTDRAAALTEDERTMLDYALNQAQLRMWKTGKYTAEDQAAIVSLRRMADEAQEEAGRG